MLRKLLFLLPLLALLLTACGDDTPITPAPEPGGGDEPSGGPTEWVTVTPRPDEWDGQRRAGITYQLLVYSFADSDGDGTGDLPGLTARLDYLDRMGVSALWLSPIHPAMSYHGYDVTDYTAVNPAFGSMADFDRLLQEAHARGIKVYLDFVLNHTGKDHPWFLEAKADADSPYRQYYTFSRDPEADIVDEANRLMKNFRQPRELPRRGRLLYDADGIRIRADTAAGTLTVSMAMPLTQGTDYSATLLNSISTVLKTLAQNKDNITRLEKNHDKLPKNTDIKG